PEVGRVGRSGVGRDIRRVGWTDGVGEAGKGLPARRRCSGIRLDSESAAEAGVSDEGVRAGQRLRTWLGSLAVPWRMVVTMVLARSFFSRASRSRFIFSMVRRWRIWS